MPCNFSAFSRRRFDFIARPNTDCQTRDERAFRSATLQQLHFHFEIEHTAAPTRTGSPLSEAVRPFVSREG
jgi:hypothetical protein